MKLALKVVLSTVLGTLLVLFAFGYSRTRDAIALFEANMRKSHRLIGATLAVCVERTWATSGPAPALELIAQADASRPELSIGWLYPDGRHVSRSPVLSELHDGKLAEAEHMLMPGPGGHQFLVTRFPVRDADKLLGAIEIAETFESRDQYLRSTLRTRLAATLGMVLVSGLVALVAGVGFVGRPLQLLAEKARRVGAGDLGGPLRLVQRDEIGTLAEQMNTMCERLAEANARTEAETRARVRAVEQLRHADRLITVGRLAAGIAHELGTPLNVIAGRAKMLSRGDVGASSAPQVLATISEQAERATAIIRQLMDFARRREPKMARIDLAVTVNSIVKLLEPLAQRRTVNVRVISAEPVIARGDPTQLEQVVSNLVVNAMQACEAGGSVELSWGLEERGGTREPTTRYAFVRIADDGHGIEPAVIDRIFEPFFTTKDVGHGTGLGLAVAHGIVQEHGGFIDVKSEVSRGSTLTVFIPSMPP